MKKALSLVLICILLLGAVIPLSAANEVTVVLDGKILEFDVPGQIIDGRTMVPLRKIFEAMGATVNYNATTKTAVAVKGDTTVSLTIGEKKITVGGVEKVLDVPGLIIDGRTLAPLRAVGEAFGGFVNWNGTTRTATITTKPAEPPKPDTGCYVDHKVLTFSAKTGIPCSRSYMESDDTDFIPGYVEGAKKYTFNTEYCTDEELFEAFNEYVDYLMTNYYWAKQDYIFRQGFLDSYIYQYTVDGSHMINLYYMHPTTDKVTNKHELTIYVVTWDE